MGRHEPRADCFAYNNQATGNRRCTALNGLYCEEERKCNFFKTKKEAEADRKKAARH